MAEKVFASLSSGLLARKGAARPAMRPQGFGQMGSSVEDLGWNDMGFEAPKPALAAVRTDGFGSVSEAPVRAPLSGFSGLTPVSPVHGQQAKIAESLAREETPEAEEVEAAEAVEQADDELLLVEAQDTVPEVVEIPAPVVAAVSRARRKPTPHVAPGTKAKAAFTLRLDPDRHLKLRLACAVSGRSAQMLVTDALDRMLDAIPELEGMASKAPVRGSRH